LLDGSPSEKALEKQDKTLSEREHGVLGSKGRGRHLLPSKGLSLESYKKSDGRTPPYRQRKNGGLGKKWTAVAVSCSMIRERDYGEAVLVPRPLAWVKEHFRRSKGLKSWIGANSLLARGIPSETPLALVERWTWIGLRESFFLMEAGRDREMDRYLSTELKDFDVKRRFIRSFGQWLVRTQLDLFHKDMKTCNILVSETKTFGTSPFSTWKIFL
jgi:hypothetical protein